MNNDKANEILMKVSFLVGSIMIIIGLILGAPNGLFIGGAGILTLAAIHYLVIRRDDIA